MHQLGVVSLGQMRAAGLTARQVERLVEHGGLERLHRGVFRVGPVVLPHSAAVAAVLACGPRAVLSHRSAAAVYGMLRAEEGPIHVTVVGRHRRGDGGVVVHETSSLARHEIRERNGVAITAPVRTLIDCASVCPGPVLEQALAEAFALGLTNRAAVLRGARATRGRRGAGRVRRLLDAGAPRRTRSVPERRLLHAIRQAGLPEPETNVRVRRWEVDFLWREAGLVVEVDGYRTHSSPRAFERDRRKDAELSSLGLKVQRFTAQRVDRDRDVVVRWIGDALLRQSG